MKIGTAGKLVLIVSLIMGLGLLGSCSARSEMDKSSAQIAPKSMAESYSASGFNGPEPVGSAGLEDAVPVKDLDGIAKPGKPGSPNALPRKRVMSGEINLQVVNLSREMALLSAAAEKIGAYVAANSQSENSANLTLRIPAERFKDFVGLASGSGKLISSQTRSDDVSDSWYDLDMRVKAKRVLLDRYLSYLRQAKDVKDLMTIERQVNDTTTELESLEGSFRNLDNQVVYSTLNINLYLPGQPDSNGFDMGNALAKLWRDVLEFLQNLVVGILYFLLFGIPILALLLLAYWLLFGRVGWMRILLVRLSAPAKPASKPDQGDSQ